MEKIKLTFKNIGGKIVRSQEITSFVPFFIIVVVATVLNPVFLRGSNLSVMATTMMAMWGILSVAQGFVVLVGEIDISIGTMFGFASMLLAVLTAEGVALGLGMVCVFVVTIGLSLVNAFTVIKLRVPVFIATIGMMFICKGLAKVVNFGAAKSIYTIERAKDYMEFGSAKLFGMSWAFIIFITLIIIGRFLLSKVLISFIFVSPQPSYIFAHYSFTSYYVKDNGKRKECANKYLLVVFVNPQQCDNIVDNCH